MNNMLPSYFEHMKPVQPATGIIMEFANLGCILQLLTMSLENRWFKIKTIKAQIEDNHETAFTFTQTFTQKLFYI